MSIKILTNDEFVGVMDKLTPEDRVAVMATLSKQCPGVIGTPAFHAWAVKNIAVVYELHSRKT